MQQVLPYPPKNFDQKKQNIKPGKYMMKLLLIFFTGCVLTVSAFGQVQTGKASFYADKFEGLPTASGERYRHNKLTAAHKTLPFGTVVKVTNTATGKSINVTINDRGPYVKGRVIDLSKRAAEELGFILDGIADVQIEVVDPGDGKSSGYPKTVDSKTVEENEFYSVQTDRIKPKGYGVQIGSYRELVNLMRLSENLKSSYQKDLTIQVKVFNGEKIYSMVIGQYNSRAKAERLLDKVRERFPQSFIVDFSRI